MTVRFVIAAAILGCFAGSGINVGVLLGVHASDLRRRARSDTRLGTAWIITRHLPRTVYVETDWKMFAKGTATLVPATVILFAAAAVFAVGLIEVMGL